MLHSKLGAPAHLNPKRLAILSGRDQDETTFNRWSPDQVLAPMPREPVLEQFRQEIPRAAIENKETSLIS
jgi:hypothetical protein